MAVRLSALRVGRPLPRGRFLVLISVRGLVDSRAIARLEGCYLSFSLVHFIDFLSFSHVFLCCCPSCIYLSLRFPYLIFIFYSILDFRRIKFVSHTFRSLHPYSVTKVSIIASVWPIFVKLCKYHAVTNLSMLMLFSNFLSLKKLNISALRNCQMETTPAKFNSESWGVVGP
jgi:hypothetical protein